MTKGFISFVYLELKYKLKFLFQNKVEIQQ